jgi:thioredoxin-related protein
MAKTPLEQPQSLPEAALRAQSKGLPLVVMTTLKGCPFCDLVRDHYLLPMTRRGELVAVQIDITDRGNEVVFFDGRRLWPQEISRLWKNRVAPTVYFFDVKGLEIAPRLEGVAVPDFFGSYLESRIETARQVLRQR